MIQSETLLEALKQKEAQYKKTLQDLLPGVYIDYFLEKLTRKENAETVDHVIYSWLLNGPNFDKEAVDCVIGQILCWKALQEKPILEKFAETTLPMRQAVSVFIEDLEKRRRVSFFFIRHYPEARKMMIKLIRYLHEHPLCVINPKLLLTDFFKD